MKIFKLMFERCDKGVRVVAFQDYDGDGNVEIVDIIEVEASVVASDAKMLVRNFTDRFGFWHTKIVCGDEVVIQDFNEDDDEIVALRTYIRKQLRETIKLPVTRLAS